MNLTFQMISADRKGQGLELLGVVFIIGVVFILSLYMTSLLISVGDDGQVDAEVDSHLTYQVEDIHVRSAYSSVLQDVIWKSPEVDKGDYNELPAYKVISLYMSTEDGEDVKIGTEEYEKDKVEEDIEDYFEYKMTQIYVDPEATAYSLPDEIPGELDSIFDNFIDPSIIIGGDDHYRILLRYESENNPKIEVTNTDKTGFGRSMVYYPIPLADEENAVVALTTSVQD